MLGFLDLESLGILLGLAICFGLLAAQKDLKLVNVRPAKKVTFFSGTASSTAVKAEASEARVEATPELEHFLEDVGQLKLLSALTQWGAKTPTDLTHLFEEDFEELGIAKDSALREAIKRLEA